MIELVIGRIAPNPDIEIVGDGLWKFIFAELDGKVCFYAGRMALAGSDYKHENVAEENNIPRNQVRGGGQMIVSNELVRLVDYSLDFGVVPNCAVECVATDLIRELKEYGVRKARVNMHYSACAAMSHKFNFKRWKEYGFEFDLYPREITF